MADPPKAPRGNAWGKGRWSGSSPQGSGNHHGGNSSGGRAGHSDSPSRGRGAHAGNSSSDQSWPGNNTPSQQQSQGIALPYHGGGGQQSSSTQRGGFRGGSARGQHDSDSQRGGRGRGRGGGDRQESRWGPPPVTEVASGCHEGNRDTTTADEVRSLENTLATRTASQEYSINADDKCKIVGRGQYGTAGRSITVATNYFIVKPLSSTSNAVAGDAKIHTYSVKVMETARGKAPSRVLKRQAVLSVTQLGAFTDIAWASDQASIIVTNAELQLADPPVNPWGARIQLHQLPHGEPTARDALSDHDILVEIKHEHSLSLAEMITVLKSPRPVDRYDNASSLIQAMNIIISKSAREDRHISSTSPTKFFANDGTALGETWQIHDLLLAQRGYYSSIRPATGQLLLNVNVASGTFYRAMPLLDLHNALSAYTTQQKTVFMKGLRVRVSYEKRKPADQPPQNIVRDRVITAACSGNADTTRITLRGTGMIQTVRRYYLDTYGIVLTSPIIVNVGSTDAGKEEYIPVQFCHTLPGQQYRRQLDTDTSGNMIQFAARAPNQNAFSIAGNNDKSRGANALRVLGLIGRARPPTGPNPQITGVHRFGFEVGTSLLQVPGRFLDSVVVQYSNLRPFMKLAGWNLSQEVKYSKSGEVLESKSPKFMTCPGVRSWGVVAIECGAITFENDDLSTAVKALINVLNDCGVGITRTLPKLQKISLTDLDRDRRQANAAAIKHKLEIAKQVNIQILLVILPSQDRWLYSKIKSLAETEVGIHTICCIGSDKKLFREKGRDQYLANLALKFNIKTGGSNHKVIDLWKGVPTGITAENTMLVGIDVTHPSPDSGAAAPSIVSLVANTNALLAQWPGSLKARSPRTEILDEGTIDERKVHHHGEHIEEDIEAMFTLRLKHWHQLHGVYPAHIILYRDGVSESQYDKVLHLELPALTKACEAVYSGKIPRFAIVIVGKRHHTRFYATEEIDTVQALTKGDNFNLKPGLVVDRGITQRTLREFFLQAHHGLQGSARPAHYVVLKDDIGFSTDKMEVFTHKLCYTFNRATKAVSICPPAYYADLLADRGRLYLHDIMNEGQAGTNVNLTQRITVCPELENSTFYI